ncbi:MAG TPA: hypothetical protein VJT77_06285 [Burkholderiales bacterium]|nr:hypothetical protein [Burkholderiales bacterium]
MQISAEQLAQLLVGIARAQAAIVNGIESETARLRDHPEPALVDLPLRILLTTLDGRPDVAKIAQELERLCARTPGSPGRDLDFGAPPP